MGKEDFADDFCFACKDGGELRICDYEDCLKAYHPRCVDKDDSFLNSTAHWSCGWHSCDDCKKKPMLQCFCCPKSYCTDCIKDQEFIQVKKKDRGFCSYCLKLAKLIEENADEDSEGGKVDFKDTATFEFLFKDYWDIVKDREKITLEELRAAYHLLKSGEHINVHSDCEKCSDDNEEYMPVETFEDDDPQPDRMTGIRTSFRKQRQKRMNYIGWGSEELIKFLKSIGKDTSVPISQMEATEIINQYAKSKNLHHPDKRKKKIKCDEKLFPLLRRKEVKSVKIFSLLDSHFPCNASDDDFNFGLEEENLLVGKRKRSTASDKKSKCSQSNKSFKGLTTCFASLIRENIKLVYLRRSVVVELLRNPEVFESKVVGCFVRVKNDIKDFFYSPKKMYQLGHVTGIRKTEVPYKMGEISTDIILSITNIWQDVRMSMLSDDDFEEEECEDLRQLASSGAFQKPTVAQLQQKANLLHQDITSHSINREIARLKKQIDLANEKGWRKELLEHIERRDLLLKKEEQERLLREKPEVILEEELSINDMCSPSKFEQHKVFVPERDPATPVVKDPVTPVLKDPVTPVDIKGINKIAQLDEYGVNLMRRSVPVHVINLDDDDDDDGDCHRNNNVTSESVDAKLDNDIKGCNNLIQDFTNTMENGKQNGSRLATTTTIDEANAMPVSLTNSRTCGSPSIKETETGFVREITTADVPQDTVQMTNTLWFYIDPYGTEQGPFKLDSLRQWRDEGYFHDDFKVWRHYQTQKEAVLLYDVLKLVENYQCQREHQM